MQPAEALEQVGRARFLDVREAYEFAAGHVDGSIHVPLLDLPERLDELDRDGTIIVVCQVGQRSDIAARFLRAQGFDAHNLEGGLARWSSEGNQLVGEQAGVVDGWARSPDWES